MEVEAATAATAVRSQRELLVPVAMAALVATAATADLDLLQGQTPTEPMAVTPVRVEMAEMVVRRRPELLAMVDTVPTLVSPVLVAWQPRVVTEAMAATAQVVVTVELVVQHRHMAQTATAATAAMQATALPEQPAV